MKACFMFGHGNCPDFILPRIEESIESQYIKHGIRCFYVGSRGRFDSLAAAAAKRVKRRYPNLRLYLLLAYHPAERVVNLTEGFDNSYYPPLENVPRPYAIVQANRYMIENCDAIICYVNHSGNTRNLLEYAQRREKKGEILIENIARND